MAANDPQPPVFATCLLHGNQCASLEPIAGNGVEQGAKTAPADILDNPDSRRIAIGAIRRWSGKGAEGIGQTMQNDRALPDRVPVMAPLRRDGRKIGGEMADHREQHPGMIVAAQIDVCGNVVSALEVIQERVDSGRCRARLEEALGRPRLGRPPRETPGGFGQRQVNPIDRIDVGHRGKDEARQEMHDQSLGQIDFQRQQTVQPTPPERRRP